MIPFNDLGRAIAAQRSDLDEAIARVLDSGWLVHGPQHEAFEAELAGFLGVAHALGVASGTDALELAMRAIDAPERDVVVTAPNAGGYATFAARACGLGVRLCDVDPDTHLLDPRRLDGLLDERVRAVVVTHLYGRMADVAEVVRVCQPRGVRVIEDCAQAIGARRPEGAAGALGDLGTYSFYPTKNLGALGDGGAVVTDDPHLAARVRSLRQYGWRDARYIATDAAGRNSRLDELQAAVLRLRLPLVEAGNERRRAIIGRYAEAAPTGVRVLPAAGAEHAGHLAVLVTAARDELAARLRARGVATAVHYPHPDDAQPGLVIDRPADVPVARKLARHILTLPCFPELTDAEVDAVCAALAAEGAAVDAARGRER